MDERFDLELLAALADAHPEWSVVVIGPVVKISEDDLPRRANIHYLGGRDYKDLPAYMSGWDVALMPFAINEATRFISPTKTLEYMAAGKPARVERHPPRPGDQLATVADVGKLLRHLGWKPTTGLDDGLAQQVEWQKGLL